MAMATEVISDFSPAEIGERVSRVQEGMKAKGWDAVLVVDEGTGGVRYLAGLSHIDSPTPSFIALGQSGDPIMVVAEGMGGSTINLLNQYTATMIESPSGRGGSLPDAICSALGKVGYKGGALAVDGGQLRFGMAENIRKNFDNVSFVPSGRLVEMARLHRSAAEQAIYKKSANIAYSCMELYMSVIRPGIRHDVAVEQAVNLTVQMGAESQNLIHGGGTPWIWGTSTRGDDVWEEGDLSSVELNPRYHGYYAQVCRTWLVGKGDPAKQKMVDDVRRILDAMYAAAKPGMTGKDVFHAGMEVAKPLGRDFQDVRWGHGVGLTIGEQFDIADWDPAPGGPCDTPIIEGAHGNFHPFFIEKGPGGRGTFNALWGDPWIMGKNGIEFAFDPPRAQL
jgi:Xaa-Pro dipeptidase